MDEGILSSLIVLKSVSNSTDQVASAGAGIITNSSKDDNATGDSTDDVSDMNDPSVLKSVSDSTEEGAITRGGFTTNSSTDEANVSGNGKDVGITMNSSSNSKAVGFTSSIEVSEDHDMDADNDVTLIKVDSISKLTKEIKATKERMTELHSLIEINAGDNTVTPPEGG